MYSFYLIVIEKVARIVKTSPNNAVYIIFTVGLAIAGINKAIEGQPRSLEYAPEIALMTYACGVFLTVLNLVTKEQDWFTKRDAIFLKAEKDAERAALAKAMYKKYHPDD